MPTTMRAPFLHAFVRAVSGDWTGTLVTRTRTGLEHRVYFERGAPSKVATGELVAPLDSVLIRQGRIDPYRLAEAVKDACQYKELLLGELLLQREITNVYLLGDALRWQILEKLDYLLGDGTDNADHALHESADLIELPGNPQLHPADPLYCIMHAGRLEACIPIVERYITRVAGMKMMLKKSVDVRRFGLTTQEQNVVALLQSAPRGVDELEQHSIPLMVVHTVVFALGVTNSLASQRTSHAPPMSMAPPSMPEPRVSIPVIAMPEETADDDDHMPPVPYPPARIQSIADDESLVDPPSDLDDQLMFAEEQIVEEEISEELPPLQAAKPPFFGWKAEAAFEEAERSLRMVNYARAVAAINHALGEDPKNPHYRALGAFAQALRIGEPGSDRHAYTEQIAVLTDVVNKAPNIEPAYYYRARLLKKLGRHNEAKRDFEMSTILNNKNVDSKRELLAYKRRERAGRLKDDVPADEQAPLSAKDRILGWFGKE